MITHISAVSIDGAICGVVRRSFYCQIEMLCKYLEGLDHYNICNKPECYIVRFLRDPGLLDRRSKIIKGEKVQPFYTRA
jgi:hypothetical protein